MANPANHTVDGKIKDRLQGIESRLDTLQGALDEIIDESSRPCEDAARVDDRVSRLADSVLNIGQVLHELVGGEKTVLQQTIEESKAVTYHVTKEIHKLSKQIDDLKLENSLGSAAHRVPANVDMDELVAKALTDAEIRVQEAEQRVMALEADKDSLNAQWKAQFDEFQAARESIETMLRSEIEAEKRRCRNLFEHVQKLKGDVRVMARIKPPTPDTPAENVVDFGPREGNDFSNEWARMRLKTPRKRVTGEIVTDTKTYDFERIFGPEDDNKAVFDEIKELARFALDGESICIFCYGQSGSGKTYTMSHRASAYDVSPEDGIIPQTLAMLFDVADQTSHAYKYTFELSLIEVYNDDILDLLARPNRGQKAKIRIDQAKWEMLNSCQRGFDLIETGLTNRAVGTTNLNEYSSRSHLILGLRITGEALEGKERGTVTTGLLNLVDLAGSERVGMAGTEGDQLREGIAINLSLTSLNRLITSLGEGTNLSFDSTLTRVLRPCFEDKNCKTLMFIMVSPMKDDLKISLQTLDKGQEATKAKIASIHRNTALTTSASSKGLRRPTLPIASLNPALQRGSPLGRLPTTPSRNTPGTPSSNVSNGGRSIGRMLRP